MLALDQIKQAYPEKLQRFERFLLKEYLQYKILELLFESPFATNLCFMGGTCLRIVHENQRFSEDLDFDNFGLSEKDFAQISTLVKTGLEREGYTVEMRNVMRGAFHCYLRFPKLLFDTGLSGHREEKILIQLDTEPQNVPFKPERFTINKFDVFTTIFTTPVDILLSQKLYAIVNRPRPKGRDFFDVTFLMARTQPDLDYLKQKMGVRDMAEAKEKLIAACEQIDFDAMVADVQAFLFDPKDEKRIRGFLPYIKQAL